MAEGQFAQVDPRWGQDDREKKAEAILHTVKQLASHDVTRGIWLDVGCGSGGVAATLARHVEQAVGIDPESWERWGDFRNEHANLTFHVGSYSDLLALFGPDSVDVVVCNQVYEHVDDPVALLSEIYRVMKPGGICYFAGPNLLWPIEPHLHWPIVHWLPRSFVMHWIQRLGVTWAFKWDARSWSYWSLTRLFRRTGFQYKSAIRERAQASVAADRAGKILRLAASMPGTGWLMPLAPGFVFMLVKPATQGRD